jgi:DNA-binding beta-propeller fold protein YncE
MLRTRIAPLLLLFCLSMTQFSGPSAQAKVRGQGWLVVANKGEQTVGVIDPATLTQVATVPEGGITGHELAVSPDGRRAYVPIYGNSGVGKPGTDGSNMVVVDLATRKVVGNLDFGHGVRPHCAVFGPKNGMLYVTTELDKSIAVIDPKALKIVASVPTGQAESHMLALSHDGTRGYTANVGPGTVSVIDMNVKKVLEIIPISKNTQRISISVDDKWVFTSDQTKPQLAVIDTTDNQVKHWVPLPAAGYGTAPTPDGRWLVIAMPQSKQVGVLDLKTMTVVHTIDVPAAPQEVLVRPDGKAAYVSCDSSRKVAVINTADWTVEKLIDAGKGVDGLAWANGQ